jgi:uncharacterized protein YggE
MWRQRTVTLAVALLVTSAFPLRAIARTADEVYTIEVNGTGEAQAPPDRATLQIAIETHATTAAAAAGNNGALAQKVSDALKRKLQDKGLMWTGGYTLYPDYSEQRNGGEARIIGYRAQNSITVQTGAMELVGPLIDAAIAAGANRVDSLDYDLRDDTKARTDAIGKASKNAQAQAQALATALGVQLGAVMKASTVTEERPLPVARARFTAALSTAATPVEAGQITVPATVSLTYEIK